MEDMPDYDITEDELNECLEYIRTGKKTLVVCTAGISRSATVCIAYLMKYEGVSYDQAFNKVKEARKFIKPNHGFVAFLKEYEKKL